MENSRSSADRRQSASRPEPSLKGRALRLLARREHTRHELARKLAAFESDSATVEQLLDELALKGWLNEARAVESLVHRRATQWGASRVLQELRAKGISSDALSAAGASLRESEFARARVVWSRRFTQPPADLQSYARQTRFLVARGFSADVVRAVLKTAAQGSDHDLESG